MLYLWYNGVHYPLYHFYCVYFYFSSFSLFLYLPGIYKMFMDLWFYFRYVLHLLTMKKIRNLFQDSYLCLQNSLVFFGRDSCKNYIFLYMYLMLYFFLTKSRHIQN